MPRPITINYPHEARTLQPFALRASVIAAIAGDVRSQIVGPRTTRMDIAKIMRSSRRMQVNGRSYVTHWEFQENLRGEDGVPAMGLVDFDQEIPNTALVMLDAGEVRDRDYVARSTAAHELAHVVFDAPWRLQHIEKTGQPPTEDKRSLMLPKARTSRPSQPDWIEWRANEFMGSLLAPIGLMHAQMLRIAAAMRIPRRANETGRLMLDGRKADPDQLQAVADELAELFGLSSAFMEYRLHRYRLVCPSQDWLGAQT